jgi:hypothetical protein
MGIRPTEFFWSMIISKILKIERANTGSGNLFKKGILGSIYEISAMQQALQNGKIILFKRVVKTIPPEMGVVEIILAFLIINRTLLSFSSLLLNYETK